MDVIGSAAREITEVREDGRQVCAQHLVAE
jgi:hypothetical protein